MEARDLKSIVLVEDDVELSEMFAEFLESEGYEVTCVLDGALALNTILTTAPSLVILDVMLPNVNGVELCRQLRSRSDVPIVMLTAQGDEFVELSSLNYGADSYLNKPIKLNILLAHIEATLRRYGRSPNIEDLHSSITVQDLVLDEGSLTVTQSGVEVQLTSGEFSVLAELVKNAGVPLSRDQLHKEIRGVEYDGWDRAIDLRISAIRKALGDTNPPHKYIKTIRGKGYLIAAR